MLLASNMWFRAIFLYLPGWPEFKYAALSQMRAFVMVRLSNLQVKHKQRTNRPLNDVSTDITNEAKLLPYDFSTSH